MRTTQEARPLTAHIRRANGRGKNVCTSAVLAYFNIDPSEYRQCQHLHDVKRILNAWGYSCRSRASQLPKGATVGQARAWVRSKRSGAREWTDSYAVVVKGHILLLGHDGHTVVDTDPRKVDRRKVNFFFRICAKGCA